MITKDSCCNNAQHLLNTFFQDLHKCTSGAEITWVHGHSIISALFQLTCPNQCWTSVSEGVVCILRLEKPTESARTCRTRRSYRKKCQGVVENDVKDIVSPLFPEFQECTADAQMEWQL